MQIRSMAMQIWSDNDRWDWALAAAAVCAALVLTFGLRRWLRSKYWRLAQTEQLELMEIPLELASKTSSLFLVVASLAAGISFLTLPEAWHRATGRMLAVVSFWQLGVWSSAAVLVWLTTRRRMTAQSEQAFASIGVLGVVMRVAVWALVLLLALENLGVDVTALVAGLGVGGIAIALAVQNVLGDLFASLSITLDRPFVVGDFVVLGDYMGAVEQIGVKSTRLRSLGGEQIVIANADLLNSRVRNYGRMFERRISFSLGVTYETGRDKLTRIPQILRESIEQQDGTRFDRSHFSKFGDSALEFETVYYVLSPDYTHYMDLQQAIYFAIHEAFEREQIEFAYPTRKIWLKSSDEARIRAFRHGAQA